MAHFAKMAKSKTHMLKDLNLATVISPPHGEEFVASKGTLSSTIAKLDAWK